jgi:AbrB family looped-hinge helix DNA binding protein
MLKVMLSLKKASKKLCTTPSYSVILRNNDRWDIDKMSAQAKLSSKFQISIPKVVREAQQWRAGQQFVFIPKGNGVMVMPAPELSDLRGIARGADTSAVRDRKDRF